MCSRMLVFSLIFSFGCFHSFKCIGQELVSHDPGVQIGIESSGTGGDDPAWSNRSDGYPRILTVLTTYNLRTAFAKANREAMEEREDGYKSLVRIRERPLLVFLSCDREQTSLTVLATVAGRRFYTLHLHNTMLRPPNHT